MFHFVSLFYICDYQVSLKCLFLTVSVDVTDNWRRQLACFQLFFCLIKTSRSQTEEVLIRAGIVVMRQEVSGGRERGSLSLATGRLAGFFLSRHRGEKGPLSLSFIKVSNEWLFIGNCIPNTFKFQNIYTNIFSKNRIPIKGFLCPISILKAETRYWRFKAGIFLFMSK